MRILFTGGAGYVGSACLRWLLSAGYDALAFDNLSEGNRAAVPGDRLIVGDIGDRQALSRVMAENQIDAVMHFAAVASVPDSIARPDEYWRINVLGTKNVLDAMRENGVTKLIFSSTAATYSFDTVMPITEESPQEPKVPYGTTKLAAEHLIKDYSGAYGIAATILRYFNASGADHDGQYGESRQRESHLIPMILATASGHRSEVRIFGGDWETPDGTCVRDFVHTDDLAQAHELAMEALVPGHVSIYNVGFGTGVSVLEALKTCEDVVGSSIRYRIVDRRPGDPATLVASPAKLEVELGWKPRCDLRSIVETAWLWHKTHPTGYADDV